MSKYLGNDSSNQKIKPILNDLLKSDNSEVKLHVIDNLGELFRVIGAEFYEKEMMKRLFDLMADS